MLDSKTVPYETMISTLAWLEERKKDVEIKKRPFKAAVIAIKTFAWKSEGSFWFQ